MKHKTQLTLFATVVLQALVLIVPVSAYATAEADPEIGVPKPVESRINGCFDAHLSPKSDRFYTLRDGSLTQYQINPLKKLGATSGDWDVIKEPGCYMRITDDEKKLLVIGNKWIYAFDLATGQLVNKAEWGYRQLSEVIINNNDLVILETYSSGTPHSHDYKYVGDLYIWDINTLKLKRKIPDFGKGLAFTQKGGVLPTMSKIQERIYMRTDSSLVVWNSQTYQPELNLSARSLEGPGKYNPKHPSAGDLPLLSKDFQRLYVMFASEVKDYLNGKHSSFDKTKSDEAFVFDQKTRHSRTEKLNNVSRSELDPVIFSKLHLSRNKNYVMHRGGGYAAQATLRNISTGARAFLYQYEEGEAILLEYTVEAKLAGFQLTSGARKYLMMDRDTRIPINDATFRKYYLPEAPNK